MLTAYASMVGMNKPTPWDPDPLWVYALKLAGTLTLIGAGIAAFIWLSTSTARADDGHDNLPVSTWSPPTWGHWQPPTWGHWFPPTWGHWQPPTWGHYPARTPSTWPGGGPDTIYPWSNR